MKFESCCLILVLASTVRTEKLVGQVQNRHETWARSRIALVYYRQGYFCASSLPALPAQFSDDRRLIERTTNELYVLAVFEKHTYGSGDPRNELEGKAEDNHLPEGRHEMLVEQPIKGDR
jgi:hypothetical protein